MAYKMTISKNNKYLFSTELFSFRQMDQYPDVFGWLNVNFPVNKGFDLQIHRYPRAMPPISREDFRKACLAKSWRAVLDLFILPEELEAFRATKRMLDLDDHDGNAHDSIESDILTAMYAYQNDLVILQYGQKKPRFLVPGHTLIEAADLATAEQESYRMYLRSNDRLPFEQ